MRFLVTGTAGFIGFHLAKRLLSEHHQVVGFDAFTSYYNVELKKARNSILCRMPGFRMFNASLNDLASLRSAFDDTGPPDIVVHLAAQAGVRYSFENPSCYISSNLVGTFNILEMAREFKPQHLLIASSSSVYGANRTSPFREVDRADWPLSLYAATKKSTEELSHSYSHLWSLPITCLRFFTVYGPWGRPDMAPWRFVHSILSGEPIDVYGNGHMARDFTYVDDIVEGIVRLASATPEIAKPVSRTPPIDSLSNVAPWRVVNLGAGRPIGLMDFIAAIENALGVTAIKKFLPMQKGDTLNTFADTALIKALTGFAPTTRVDDGVQAFADWYRSLYDRDCGRLNLSALTGSTS